MGYMYKVIQYCNLKFLRNVYLIHVCIHLWYIGIDVCYMIYEIVLQACIHMNIHDI